MIIIDKTAVMLLVINIYIWYNIVAISAFCRTVFQFNHAASRTDSLRNADNLSALIIVGKSAPSRGALCSQTPREYTYAKCGYRMIEKSRNWNIYVVRYMQQFNYSKKCIKNHYQLSLQIFRRTENQM